MFSSVGNLEKNTKQTESQSTLQLMLPSKTVAKLTTYLVFHYSWEMQYLGSYDAHSNTPDYYSYFWANSADIRPLFFSYERKVSLIFSML